MGYVWLIPGLVLLLLGAALAWVMLGGIVTEAIERHRHSRPRGPGSVDGSRAP